MKVLLGHLNWGLKGLHSDPGVKNFGNQHVVSNVAKGSKLLLKMESKLLLLAPVLFVKIHPGK